MSAPEMNVMGLMNYILLHLTSLSTYILDMNVIVIYQALLFIQGNQNNTYDKHS